MNNYKWHLVIITFSLIITAMVYAISENHDAPLFNESTKQNIQELKLLSLSDNSSAAGLTEEQRKKQIARLIHKIEQNINESSQNSTGKFGLQQKIISIIIVLIFIYLSFVLRKLLATSKKIEESNSRIKSEIAKIQMTFTSIGDAVITTDQHGFIDYMNKSARKLTNYPFDKEEKPSIKTVFKLFNEDNFLLANPVEQAILEDRVIKGKHNIFLQQHDGTHLPVIYTIAPIHDSKSNIIGTINVFHDTCDTHKLTKALSWQAAHDALTKLPNRLLHKDKLEHSLEEARINKTLLTVFFIDLDGFKSVNEEYGYQQGDQVLKIIAQRLLLMIRDEDMVARLGGDEFVITLLSFDNFEEITQALKRVTKTIAQPIPVGSDELILSASIGVTSFPNDDSDADTLLRHSNQAMYIAKQKGRNQYHIFDVKSNQITALKEQQRNRIEEGFNNGEFFLEYQPKVNMRTGKIYGFEALVRWHDPDTGIVYPDEFIPLCEDGELIVFIGDWVFNQALKQLQYWLKSGFDYHLAVNISAQQFQASDFIEKLDRLLLAYPDISANYIELEVLESAALQDTKKVSEIIVACHERNISIALDDFGSGYASLSYLKQLPANQLKIDKSFVIDMLSDEGDRAIVEGIINLAKIFNSQVVAEGVESGEHGVMLLRLGCDMAQGYGISQPLTADNVLSWAKTWRPDPNWLLWSETTWDISDFPLLIAHSDHLSGINNVIKSVEQYNSETELFDLLSYNHCRLGIWYYNIGKSKYQHLPCYQDLEQPHKKTHQLGKKLLQLCSDGKQSEALKMIPELIKLRDDVLIKLNALQQGILEQKK
ncbi:MAG: hypothetical protein DRQ43_00420 [Gammaproteobacteria bacterium]|nr:MAG: hypothetical protein DRQ43_00420 [Gammaproteobacteria bacterium]